MGYSGNTSVDDVRGFKPSDGLPRAVKIDNVKGNSIGIDTDQVGDGFMSKLKITVSKEIGDIVCSKSMIEDDTNEVSDRVEVRAALGSKLEKGDTREFCEKSQTRSWIISQSVIIISDSESESSEGKVGKEAPKHCNVKSSERKFMGGSEDKNSVKNQSQGDESIGLESFGDTITMQALMGAPKCPSRQGEWLSNSNVISSSLGECEWTVEREEPLVDDKQKSVSKRNENNVSSSNKRKTPNKTSSFMGKSDSKDKNKRVVKDDEDSVSLVEVDDENALIVQESHDSSVSLIPFVIPNSNGKDDDHEEIVTRNKVRETLRLFQAICRKLLQEEEAKSKEQGQNKRVDLRASKLLREKNKWVNTGKQILGNVPGVEVGDEFQCRVELAIIGLHRQFQGGIDYAREGEEIFATSIVASGGYDDDMGSSDVLIYSGQGGNPLTGHKKPEDQKLERGNLALKNSMDAQKPVRVIRGFKEIKGRDSMNKRPKKIATYTYDGLYLVDNFWTENGHHDCCVFKFQLRRIPGQPEVALKEAKKSKKLKVREGLCVDDISQGNEKMPICAINNIDDERPLPFKYITKIIYPSWYNPTPPRGCECIDGCSDSEKCSCAVKNGGEIPFNYNGAIVEAKPLVYECGPSCKCPSSCHNRVSQHGIKFRLEIFKTNSRGWGVRSLTSIPSGSFICEYMGELLQDTEADQRTGNDEYLFDIGHNYNDHALWDGVSTLLPDLPSSPLCKVIEDVCFTIDAAEYGNVGRFINHSCSPNLYAQNLLYDHDDMRMPHIMLFAAENIPPLQELTYHYNYTLDQVRDSHGNIKRKNCYCGSHECTGRLY
ncbi:histone-lysine N-methyltransferase, H3 lysine-9 specific SUVH6-like isoform X2 [Tasmannia lanceolata]